MYLDVPFVSQLNFGKDNIQMDPTGCWYASACMVNYSFETGPRLGVPALHSRPINHANGTPGLGHWPMDFGWLPTFMQNEKLMRLEGGFPQVAVTVLVTLKKYGPLIVYWEKTNAQGKSYGHASVLIGIDSGTLIIHDPENAPRSRIPLEDFLPMNRKMAGDKDQWWPVLRRDAPEFTSGARSLV
ncbi:papain-like cysteine protease family protein [Belnapia sp. F-4-1]|uniref:papain-like cysteine protease family protein n=1 Tax=Belnapia sp. F-4-1 TaxID=1545443 RepID=UPI0009DD1584|nr:papain-like cysteine protease family protein [Belnapia sp. F-4-1]